MTYSIKQLFHIDADISAVFKAISTIEGLSKWWTLETTGGSNVGETISFRFGVHGGPDMKVTEITEDKSVSWICDASNHGWKGHTFTFLLDRNDGKTRVRFSHNDWAETDDFYAGCSFSWGRYMESLRELCQTGKGKPFGSE